MSVELLILGIRHHGSGSCLRMMKALEDFGPDHLCIELPYETRSIIPQLQDPNLKYPLAFLLYDEKNINHCSYLPMAIFSPECQAIQYALKNNVAITPIDLPASVSFHSEKFNSNLPNSLSWDQKNMIRDPIGYLAKQDGYNDGEMWWETLVEHHTEDDRIFDIVLQLMSHLRVQSHQLDDDETLCREAWMMQEVKKVIRSGAQKLAIVCGAWHAPIFQEIKSNKFTNEIKKYKLREVKAALVPWNYKRLALNNQYTAGIASPIWHHYLFMDQKHAVASWLSHTALLLRRNDFFVSTAQVIDAEVLALQLALIRRRILPNIDDLIDAAVCCFCEGKEDVIELIKSVAIIGDVKGDVPIHALSLPFQIEFFKLMKDVQLHKIYIAGSIKSHELDLRKEKHLLQSKFFHLCTILDFNWCSLDLDSSVGLGTFREVWNITWNPELEVRLIELSLLGNSISAALIIFIKDKLNANMSLDRLCILLDRLLKSGWTEPIDAVMDHINQRINFEFDVVPLTRMIRPLMSALQYGSLHQFDARIISNLLENIMPKCIVLFRNKINSRNPELGRDWIVAMSDTHYYFIQLNHDKADWKQCLVELSNSVMNHPMVVGKSWNLLIEMKYDVKDSFDAEINFIFNSSSDIEQQILFLEGFFYQSTQFNNISQKILIPVSHWLESLEDERFKEVLVFMRRIFSEFNVQDKQRIMDTIQHYASPDHDDSKLIQFIIDINRNQLLDRMF